MALASLGRYGHQGSVDSSHVSSEHEKHACFDLLRGPVCLCEIGWARCFIMKGIHKDRHSPKSSQGKCIKTAFVFINSYSIFNNKQLKIIKNSKSNIDS